MLEVLDSLESGWSLTHSVKLMVRFNKLSKLLYWGKMQIQAGAELGQAQDKLEVIIKVGVEVGV